MRLPDFLVLGAQKAGSTWIYDCLKLHPEVFMPAAIELHYFNRLDYDTPEQHAAYDAHFAGSDGYRRVGEKTPGYFWSTDRARSTTQPPAGHNPDIPGAVRNRLGDDVDFIVSLRHPVWRAISAFGHHVKRDRIHPRRTLHESASKLGILDIGFYGAHLKSWYDAVGPARFEVLIFEDDIVAAPEEGFRKLCRFLGIDEEVTPAGLFKASNAGVAREIDVAGITVRGHPLPIGPDDIEYLVEAYRDDIALTKELLGRDLASWDAETERLLAWCASARAARPAGAATGAAAHATDGAAVRDRARDTSPKGAQAEQRAHGLDIAPRMAQILDRRFIYEPPVRAAQMILRESCTMGAFSHAVSGHAYSTRIGRYCSIARDVNIGQFEAPRDWLSTNPFQFQKGFGFATGAQFADKDRYEAAKPDGELVARAREEMTRVTTIGNDVSIGHGAVIAAGVSVGDGAVIGAGAVVTGDVEPYAVMEGVPAKRVAYRFDKKTRTRMQDVQWWRYATWQLEGVPFADPGAALDEIERRVREEGMEPYAPRRVVQSGSGPEIESTAPGRTGLDGLTP